MKLSMTEFYGWTMRSQNGKQFGNFFWKQLYLLLLLYKNFSSMSFEKCKMYKTLYITYIYIYLLFLGAGN